MSVAFVTNHAGYQLGARFYAIILIGICRRVIDLSDNVPVFALGIPFFIIVLALF